MLLNSATAGDLSEAVIGISSDVARYEEMSLNATKTAQKYSLEDWRDFIGDTLRRAWNVPTLA